MQGQPNLFRLKWVNLDGGVRYPPNNSFTNYSHLNYLRNINYFILNFQSTYIFRRALTIQ